MKDSNKEQRAMIQKIEACRETQKFIPFEDQ